MVNLKSTPSFLKPVSGARSQKEGVDVDSSESKGVTNGGSGHKSHSPPAEKRIAEESTVRYL